MNKALSPTLFLSMAYLGTGRHMIYKMIHKINQTQKVIILIAVAVVLFFVTYPIALKKSNGIVVYSGSAKVTFSLDDAFALEYTWYVWLVYTAIVGGVGFVLFNKKSN